MRRLTMTGMTTYADPGPLSAEFTTDQGDHQELVEGQSWNLQPWGTITLERFDYRDPKDLGGRPDPYPHAVWLSGLPGATTGQVSFGVGNYWEHDPNSAYVHVQGSDRITEQALDPDQHRRAIALEEACERFPEAQVGQVVAVAEWICNGRYGLGADHLGTLDVDQARAAGR